MIQPVAIATGFFMSALLPNLNLLNLYDMEPTNIDEKLWRLARKRAAFKKSLFSYLVINAFLWGIWWITVGKDEGFRGYPWPVWVMLGWGVGLGFQYFDAYNGNKSDLVEKEYEKLRKGQK